MNAQPDIAGRSFAERLYNDFTKIFSRLKAFDPVDLINWGEAARTETRAYEARMAAMTEAALTEKDISIVMSHMESNNMIMSPPTEFYDGGAIVSWVLEGQKKS